jgi:hypothetical protein
MTRDFVPDPNRPPPSYKDLGTVQSPDSDWAVRVQTRETGRPVYSYEFGKMREGKFLRYVAAGVTTFDGIVTVPELDWQEIGKCMPACYAVIREDAQRRESEYQSQRPSRRDDGGGYGRPDNNSQRRTGKTERQREKGKAGKPSRRGDQRWDG